MHTQLTDVHSHSPALGWTVPPKPGNWHERLRAILDHAKKQREILDYQQRLQNSISSISATLGLDTSRRGENLRILRANYGATQEEFVRILDIGSQSSYSRIERGEAQLDDKLARKIEADLKLAPGWLDRNNGWIAICSNDEFQLIQELMKSPPEATTLLIEAVKNTRRVTNDRVAIDEAKTLKATLVAKIRR